MMIVLTARDVSRLLVFGTTVAFAVCADFGFGISRELTAPSETKIPAVKAAQRAPCVIASYRIDKTMGIFLGPKRARNDGSIPPESPELRAAVNWAFCSGLKLEA